MISITYEHKKCSLSCVLKARVEKDVMIAAFEGVVDSGLIARIWDTEADDEANAEAFDMYLLRECRTRLQKFYQKRDDVKDHGARALRRTQPYSSSCIPRYPALAFASMHEFRKLGVKILLNLSEEDDKYGMYPRDIGGDGDDMELFGRHVVLNAQELDAHNDRRIVGYAPTSFDGKFYRVQARLDGDVRYDPLSVQNAPQPARIADDDYGVPVGTSTPHARGSASHTRTGFDEFAAADDDINATYSGLPTPTRNVRIPTRTLETMGVHDLSSRLAVLVQGAAAMRQRLNESFPDFTHTGVAISSSSSSSESSESSDADDVYDEGHVEHVNDDDVLVGAVAAAVRACLVDDV